jgi:hypothetical protein
VVKLLVGRWRRPARQCWGRNNNGNYDGGRYNKISLEDQAIAAETRELDGGGGR